MPEKNQNQNNKDAYRKMHDAIMLGPDTQTLRNMTTEGAQNVILFDLAQSIKQIVNVITEYCSPRVAVLDKSSFRLKDYALIRTACGWLYIGIPAEISQEKAILLQARRIYEWDGTPFDLAKNGAHSTLSYLFKLSTVAHTIMVLNCVEIIPMSSAEVAASILNIPDSDFNGYAT